MGAAKLYDKEEESKSVTSVLGFLTPTSKTVEDRVRTKFLIIVMDSFYCETLAIWECFCFF